MERKLLTSWDQPPDVAIGLQTYISVAEDPFIEYDFLPEVVFLGFRWLCDSKQRYSNGSIQRNVHYTTLFVGAIIQLLSSKKFNMILEYPILQTYDFIIGQIGNRKLSDRSRIAKLRLMQHETIENLKQLELEKKALQQQINTSKRYAIWMIAFISFLVLALVSHTLVIENTSMQIPIFAVNNWELLLVFVSLIVPSAIGLSNRFKNKD